MAERSNARQNTDGISQKERDNECAKHTQTYTRILKHNYFHPRDIIITLICKINPIRRPTLASRIRQKLPRALHTHVHVSRV